jgi:hypothetical protein
MSHRTQVTLTDAQFTRLIDESRRTGVSLAELVRRALAATYGGRLGADATTATLEETCGAWQGRELDGETYVEAVRRGMGRRLAG